MYVFWRPTFAQAQQPIHLNGPPCLRFLQRKAHASCNTARLCPSSTEIQHCLSILLSAVTYLQFPHCQTCCIIRRLGHAFKNTARLGVQELQVSSMVQKQNGFQGNCMFKMLNAPFFMQETKAWQPIQINGLLCLHK